MPPLVFLWIKVHLNEDVHLTLSRPVQNLLAEIRNIAKVQLVVGLLKSWSFLWAWV